MRHEFDHRGSRYAVTPDGISMRFATKKEEWSTPTKTHPDVEALCRETLRLAQREADLLASIESQRGSHARAAESQARRIAEVELELAGVKRVNEVLGGKVNTLARTNDAVLGVNAQLRQRIEALERENREKCLELAEKAGRIRELEAEVRSLRTEGSHTFEVLNWTLADDSRSHHAVMLADHADRLKALAKEVDHLREDFLASTEDFQRRLAALEAGKE